MKIYKQILRTITDKGAAYLVLIDPDKINGDKLSLFVNICAESGVDGFLIGGSLMLGTNLRDDIKLIKSKTNIPVIIFPGSVTQLFPDADALLFISLISGRNAEQIIGHHVTAAPIIKKMGIEPISTGYMLVESGKSTTAEYMSSSKPIPRDKPEIAAATALAAEYLGMKFVYLEAGSGAELSVPNDMIKKVSEIVSIPVIAGGGIKTPDDARKKVEHGAGVIVTGNYFENENNWNKLKDFAEAVHFKN
ncbi:MAG: geranylgeranylglyceryl/heptaprenylglyceryl phosphate synthase [Melioribacteraceae bacterium]|nr:geranylgeranylglyceryl/heptaprenylglyceryl phosphate synthase [Melioribacteraceae bacterium]